MFKKTQKTDRRSAEQPAVFGTLADLSLYPEASEPLREAELVKIDFTKPTEESKTENELDRFSLSR